MTSQGDGRNLIYFQTYDFEFFCKIQDLTPVRGIEYNYNEDAVVEADSKCSQLFVESLVASEYKFQLNVRVAITHFLQNINAEGIH
jgi:hypothetical protein